MQTPFRLLRKLVPAKGAECQKHLGVRWEQGVRVWGGGGVRKCSHRISQEPCEAQGGSEEGGGPQWYLQGIPTSRSRAQRTHGGPSP